MEQETKKTKGKRIGKIILISLCVLVLLFSLVSFFVVMYMFRTMFDRADVPDNTIYIRYEDVESDKYPREQVNFKSGENTLTGFIYGASNTKGLIVISHGLGGYSESYFAETCWFVDKGYRVFAYDNTGSGNSEGRGTIGMAQSAIDLEAALDFSKSDERLNSLPVFLYGHSWGGYAVTAVLDNGHDISAVASLAGYNTPIGIVYETAQDMLGKLFAAIEYPFMWINNKILFGSESDVSAVDSINSTDTPVMIIHGKTDETILYDGASIIAQKDKITNPNVVFKTVGGNHNSLYMTEQAGKYLAETEERGNELLEQYDGDIPDDIEEEYYASVAKEKVSELSLEFMQEVDDFFTDSINN